MTRIHFFALALAFSFNLIHSTSSVAADPHSAQDNFISLINSMDNPADAAMIVHKISNEWMHVLVENGESKFTHKMREVFMQTFRQIQPQLAQGETPGAFWLSAFALGIANLPGIEKKQLLELRDAYQKFINKPLFAHMVEFLALKTSNEERVKNVTDGNAEASITKKVFFRIIKNVDNDLYSLHVASTYSDANKPAHNAYKDFTFAIFSLNSGELTETVQGGNQFGACFSGFVENSGFWRPTTAVASAHFDEFGAQLEDQDRKKVLSLIKKRQKAFHEQNHYTPIMHMDEMLAGIARSKLQQKFLKKAVAISCGLDDIDYKNIGLESMIALLTGPGRNALTEKQRSELWSRVQKRLSKADDDETLGFLLGILAFSGKTPEETAFVYEEFQKLESLKGKGLALFGMALR